jgi:hypothetical protein
MHEHRTFSLVSRQIRKFPSPQSEKLFVVIGWESANPFAELFGDERLKDFC